MDALLIARILGENGYTVEGKNYEDIDVGIVCQNKISGLLVKVQMYVFLADIEDLDDATLSEWKNKYELLLKRKKPSLTTWYVFCLLADKVTTSQIANLEHQGQSGILVGDSRSSILVADKSNMKLALSSTMQPTGIPGRQIKLITGIVKKGLLY